MNGYSQSQSLWRETGPDASWEGIRVKARAFDRIWHIQGTVPLGLGQSADDAFDRLDPLFHERGTTYARNGDTLTFEKKDQAPQDKMSIFDSGVLQIGRDETGPVLRYRLASRTLLYCFFAPVLFLSFAGATLLINEIDKPTAEETAAKKKKDEENKLRYASVPLHPIDQFLGAPAPETAKEKTEDRKAKAEAKEEEGGRHSPKAAYVFAGLFAALYAAGRLLEDRLAKRLFQKRLQSR